MIHISTLTCCPEPWVVTKTITSKIQGESQPLYINVRLKAFFFDKASSMFTAGSGDPESFLCFAVIGLGC